MNLKICDRLIEFECSSCAWTEGAHPQAHTSGAELDSDAENLGGWPPQPNYKIKSTKIQINVQIWVNDIAQQLNLRLLGVQNAGAIHSGTIWKAPDLV